MDKFILTVFLILLFSCSKQIEIEIPKQESKLVINSTIGVQHSFYMPDIMFLLLEIKDTKHIFDTTNNYIENPDVYLYKNNILIDTIEYIDTTKIYSLNQTPFIGDKYSIRIKKGDYKTITANTSIPSKVIITDTVITPLAYIDDEGFAVSEIVITFTDPADEINFYEIAVSDIGFTFDNSDVSYYKLSTNDNIITSENYYPSLIRFDLKKPEFLLFRDSEINGMEHSLNVYYTPPQTWNSIGMHYITVHLRNVTEEYYNFKTSMLQHFYSKKEDILYGQGEPLNVIGNIKNGYGIFAGYNNDMASFRINSSTINK